MKARKQPQRHSNSGGRSTQPKQAGCTIPFMTARVEYRRFRGSSVQLPATYARDHLHVGAGILALAWPWWDGLAGPLTIVGAAAVLVALMPVAADRVEVVARFHRSVTGGDEAFGGVVFYTLSFAVMTGAGLTAAPFPAAASPAAAAGPQEGGGPADASADQASSSHARVPAKARMSTTAPPSRIFIPRGADPSARVRCTPDAVMS